MSGGRMHAQVGGPTRWSGRRLWSCVLLVALAPSSLARAADLWVVVAADADGDTLAADVRQAVVLPPGATFLDETTLRERLSPPIGAVVDVNAARGLLDAADRAFNAVEHEKSVGLLEQLTADLEADTAFSSEKLAVLQTARLQAARRLLGLAGPGETGKAETKNGARARAHLAAALRADPTLILDPASTPPKLRSLLALATDDVKQGGHGGMSVTSTPPGSTVVLEGRPQGLTPLITAPTVASGRYRLWLEKDGRKSLVRTVDVGTTTVAAEINLVIEGALRPAGPGLAPPLQPFVTDELARLARRLGVARLAVVGRAGDEVWIAVFGDDGVLLDADRGAFGAGRLAGIVTTTSTTASPTARAAVPADFATFVAPAVIAAGATDAGADGDFPWLPVGIGAGVVGAVVVGAGVAGLVWALTPEQTTVGISVRRAP